MLSSDRRAESRSHDQPRFVVLYHRVGSQLGRTSRSHFDWMFQVDRTLRTWATPPIGSFEHGFAVNAQPLADHRLKYLEHEGEISGNRGSVERVISGTFEVREDAGGRFRAQLRWEDDDAVEHCAALSVQRRWPASSSESESSWRLRLEPCG